MIWSKKPHKPDYNNAVQLEEKLRALQEHAAKGDAEKAKECLEALHAAKKLGDPLVMSVMRGTMDIFAKSSPASALNFCAEALNLCNEHPPFLYESICTLHPDFCTTLGGKALALIERNTNANAATNAAVVRCCQAIVEGMHEAEPEKTLARRYWREAMDDLAKNSIARAFTLASQAAAKSVYFPSPLKDEAIEVWEKAVENRARQNRRAAMDEAVRIGYGYAELGDGAADFKRRAQLLLRRL